MNQLLRFTTAGSVDDGKSTLIGRLLFDSKSIFEDQLEAVTASSSKKGFDYVDLSLLTDGLNPNVSKVLPSMLPIVILLPLNGSLLLPIHRGIYNIPATW